MPLPSNEFFKEECLKKIVQGDIFTYKNPVITIKTKGRAYGSISKQAVERGISLPELSLGFAEYREPYIFVALWDDENEYSEEHMYRCAAAVMSRAASHHVSLIAMPLLGGKEAMAHLWLVEKALFEAGDNLHNMGFPIPEHVYVTDHGATR